MASGSAPVWTNPSGGAWTYKYAGLPTPSSPLLTGDGAVIFPAGYVEDGVRRGWVYGVDLATGLLRWPRVATPAMYTTSAALAGSLAYYGDESGRFVAFDVQAGVEAWSLALGSYIDAQPVVVDDVAYVGVAAGRFYAIDLEKKAVKWYVSIDLGTSQYVEVTSCAYLPPYLVIGVSSAGKGRIKGLPIFGPHDPVNKAWSYDPKTTVTSDPASAAGLAFFGCNDKLLAIEANGRVAWWSKTTGGAIAGRPAADDRYVYYGSESGSFFAKAWKADAKPAEWQVPVTGSIDTGIALAGGDAFFGGTSVNGHGALYVLDLASGNAQSAQVLIENMDDELVATPAIRGSNMAFTDAGKEAGTVYVVGTGEKNMLSRVQFSARLIVDTYAVVDGSAKPLAAAHQMAVTILDENMAAAPYASVELWVDLPSWDTGASFPLDVNGTDVVLQSGVPVVVQADAAGGIRLTAGPSIGLPSLYLRPDFYDPGYAMAVFPDQRNLDTLATLHGPRLLAARSYDGKRLVLSKYRSDKEQAARNTASMAQAIRNTVGRQRNVASSRLGSTSGGAAAGRGLAPGDVANWLTVIGDTVSFHPMSAEEIEAKLDPARVRSDFDVFGDFADFVKNVVHGAEKTAEVVWSFAESSANVLVTALQGAVETGYSFVVETLEQALQVVEAILKEVVTSVQKFIEWLSYLFDWKDIVSTHDEILARVHGSLDWATAQLGALLAQGASQFHQLIAGWKENAAEYLAGVSRQMTGQTIGSAQQSAGPVTAIFRPKGVDIRVQSDWLMRKFTSVPSAIDNDPAGSELMAAVEAYFAEIETILGADPALQQLPDDVLRVVTSLAELFRDPGGALAQTIDALLAVFADVIDLALDFVDAVVEATIHLVIRALALVRQTLSAKIDVPFLSDFYRAIAGRDLSLLDFTALYLAVPATLTYKLEHERRPTPELAVEPVARTRFILDVAGAFAYVSQLPFWSLNVIPKDPVTEKALQGVVAAGSIALFGLSVPLPDEKPGLHDWVFWASQATDPILTTYGLRSAGMTGQGQTWNEAAPTVYAVMGLIYVAEAEIYAGAYPDGYLGALGHSFLINLFSALPMFSETIVQEEIAGELSVAVAAGMSTFCCAAAIVLTLGFDIAGLSSTSASARTEDSALRAGSGFRRPHPGGARRPIAPTEKRRGTETF